MNRDALIKQRMCRRDRLSVRLCGAHIFIGRQAVNWKAKSHARVTGNACNLEA